jgi:hypothetical protein
MQHSTYHVDSGFDDMGYNCARPVSSTGPRLPEMRLWAPVILLAFIDSGILSGPRGPSGPEEAKIIRRRSLHWLLHDRRDFPAVCELAGVNPAVIREAARNAMLERLAEERIG